jgi:hypothetical protein
MRANDVFLEQRGATNCDQAANLVMGFDIGVSWEFTSDFHK